MSENENVSRRNFLKKSGVGAGLIGLGMQSSNLYPDITKTVSPAYGQEKSSPREVWVMSIIKQKIAEKKDIIDGMIERIDMMSSYRPDIICLPEIVTTTHQTAEEVPGPVIKRMASVAKKLNTYIICPVYTKKNGKIYNSAVVIDREGEVIGQYDKIHPTINDLKKGTIPGGHPPPVFKTDFGTIGIQICFDINWTNEWQSLKEQGAEIVFWPSAYPGGRMLPSYAWQFKYYIVGCSWRDPATIYDMTGDLIASSGQYEPWAFAKLNLEKVFLEIVDYHKKLDEIKKKYGRKVLIRYYHDEDWVTIESCSPELKINDILKEYSLIPHWDYIKIEEKEQDRIRNINK